MTKDEALKMDLYLRNQQIQFNKDRLKTAVAVGCHHIANKIISRFVPPELHSQVVEQMKKDIDIYLELSYD
jgi:predicted ABC-type ATPase